jgi:hypothetical protein
MNTEIKFDAAHSDAIRRALTDVVAADAVSAPVRHRNRVIAVVAASALAIVLTAGSALWTLNAAGLIFTPSATPGGPATAAPALDWPRNATGQTYGVQGNSSVAPDLIKVLATNGKTGYVYSKQLAALDGPAPTSPKEALDWQKAHEGETVSIPVYLSDGKTVVGEFDMTYPSGHETSPAP